MAASMGPGSLHSSPLTVMNHRMQQSAQPLRAMLPSQEILRTVSMLSLVKVQFMMEVLVRVELRGVSVTHCSQLGLKEGSFDGGGVGSTGGSVWGGTGHSRLTVVCDICCQLLRFKYAIVAGIKVNAKGRMGEELGY